MSQSSEVASDGAGDPHRPGVPLRTRKQVHMLTNGWLVGLSPSISHPTPSRENDSDVPASS